MWTLRLLFPANLWVLDCWAGRMSHMNKSVSALGCKLNMLSILFNSVFGKRLPTVLREFVFHPPKKWRGEVFSLYMTPTVTRLHKIHVTVPDEQRSGPRWPPDCVVTHTRWAGAWWPHRDKNEWFLDRWDHISRHALSPIQSEIWLCNLCHNTLLTTMQLSHMFRLFHRRVYLWM